MYLQSIGFRTLSFLGHISSIEINMHFSNSSPIENDFAEQAISLEILKLAFIYYTQ